MGSDAVEEISECLSTSVVISWAVLQVGESSVLHGCSLAEE